MTLKANIPENIPLTIQWIFKISLIYLFIFTILRIATVVLFIPANVSVFSLFPSFRLGFRYAAKWISWP